MLILLFISRLHRHPRCPQAAKSQRFLAHAVETTPTIARCENRPPSARPTVKDTKRASIASTIASSRQSCISQWNEVEAHKEATTRSALRLTRKTEFNQTQVVSNNISSPDNCSKIYVFRLCIPILQSSLSHGYP